MRCVLVASPVPTFPAARANFELLPGHAALLLNVFARMIQKADNILTISRFLGSMLYMGALPTQQQLDIMLRRAAAPHLVAKATPGDIMLFLRPLRLLAPLPGAEEEMPPTQLIVDRGAIDALLRSDKASRRSPISRP